MFPEDIVKYSFHLSSDLYNYLVFVFHHIADFKGTIGLTKKSVLNKTIQIFILPMVISIIF